MRWGRLLSDLISLNSMCSRLLFRPVWCSLGSLCRVRWMLCVWTRGNDPVTVLTLLGGRSTVVFMLWTVRWMWHALSTVIVVIWLVLNLVNITLQILRWWVDLMLTLTLGSVWCSGDRNCLTTRLQVTGLIFETLR